MSSEDKTVEPSDQGPSLPSVSAGATSTGSPAQTDKRPRGRPRKDAATTIVPQAPPTTTSKTRKKGRTRGRVVVEEEDSSMDGTEAAASESPLRTTTVTWPLVEEPARQSRCDSLGGPGAPPFQAFQLENDTTTVPRAHENEVYKSGPDTHRGGLFYLAVVQPSRPQAEAEG
ncbi:histone-lysine N-methyltransferase 2C-like [Salvelinus sp. IW2-2015]|uniref:histone-lysine N-methyltransferase 2C-like n=1 Tax=Salvelinus sp. IW2-2015 TaxID=2691554 RepID=UPI0038D4850B